MEEKKFYIFSNGEAQGPFSERGLELLCAQKRITGETLICSEGNQNWMPYSDFLKNRPVMINESIPEEAVSQTVSQGFQEVKIPFTSMTVQAFGVMGGIIIILSILQSYLCSIYVLYLVREDIAIKEALNFSKASSYFSFFFVF